MDVRQKVYDYLNEMGIEYTVDEHEAVYTIEEVDKMGVFNKGVGLRIYSLEMEVAKDNFF